VARAASASVPAVAPPSAGPAVPADAKPEPAAAPDAASAVAYGPDDPAYGPPAPGWYQRDEERAPQAAGATVTADAGGSHAARGPFEPFSPRAREEAAHADYEPTDAGAALDDSGGYPLDSETPEYEPFEPIDDEMSELLGLGEAADPVASSLGQLKDLYERAETVSQVSLDRHFNQLLERQRQLISEYFKESSGPGPAGAGTPEPADLADPAVPFGFDTAQSLAGLRGELRGAQ
jgi:hypothetical protein